MLSNSSRYRRSASRRSVMSIKTWMVRVSSSERPGVREVETRKIRSADAATYSSFGRSEEHTSELQSQSNLVCRLLLEKKKIDNIYAPPHGSYINRVAAAITAFPSRKTTPDVKSVQLVKLLPSSAPSTNAHPSCCLDQH